MRAYGTRPNCAAPAAYYPWLHTTIVAERDLGYENIAKPAAALTPLLELELASLAQSNNWNAAQIKQHRDAFAGITKDWQAAAVTEPVPKLAEDKKSEWIKSKRTLVNTTLDVISPLFRSIRSAMRDRLNLLPPSAAMAGIYTMVDNTRGVWKAPANVGVNGVRAPAVEIPQEAQEDLNVTAHGKSINAIRSFTGEGVLVRGARTLDGNSLDWRYINVRRTMIMIEASCRLAAKALVFEPNVAATWVTLRDMLQNFLTSIWKQGGLAGAVPQDAFNVHVGLGETMTAQDVAEGVLRVTLLVAISRPAEFIEITFQQQMQKS